MSAAGSSSPSPASSPLTIERLEGHLNTTKLRYIYPSLVVLRWPSSRSIVSGSCLGFVSVRCGHGTAPLAGGPAEGPAGGPADTDCPGCRCLDKDCWVPALGGCPATLLPAAKSRTTLGPWPRAPAWRRAEAGDQETAQAIRRDKQRQVMEEQRQQRQQRQPEEIWHAF
ncbi:hypothetical protein ABBQ38_014699 [Trebouxia sp. C0009 RCD-2024]